MKNFCMDSVVHRKDDHLLVSKLGDDLVMMDIENGAYLSLNKTGRIIWEQIESPAKVRDIIQTLTGLFEVDEEMCKSETFSFLEKLAERKAVEIDSL